MSNESREGRAPNVGGGGLVNQVTNRIAPINPIMQAAQLQSEAMEQAIPFFQPFQEAGLGGLQSLQQGATPQGLDEILGQIFGSGNFQNLVGERTRAAQGQLAAGGLTRSGQGVSKIANIPTELGFAIEQMLSGRAGDLAGRGQAASMSIADLLSGSAEATASGILGMEERRAGNRAQKSNTTSQLLGAAIGGLFSDPQLKENIKTYNKIGPLTLCTWGWKKGYEGTLVEDSPKIGFMSTDVREHFPEYVGEFGGYDIIDYKGLIKELEQCH